MCKEEKECVCPICRLFSCILGSEAIRHLRQARKEVLLAVRSLIDARIEALEKKEEELEHIEVE
ncbi:MAG TPA: hypothetical protein EYP85_15670 [Armatimonadetes bacterium]|nr:hypothetical protein [Armatimonadota bacterium]